VWHYKYEEVKMPVIVSTIEEALDFLEKNTGQESVKIQLSGELKTLKIEIEGPLFKGAITGELARGLAEFQDEIYRAARFSLLGDNGRLTTSQKEAFELSIEVKEGCTLINIDLGKLAEGLTSTLQTMTPGELTLLAVAVATVLAAAWVGKGWLAEHYKANTELSNNQEETKRLTVVTTAIEKIVNSDRRISRFADAGSNGIREIASRATDATSIKVGRAELDEDALLNLKRRAPRSNSEALHEVGLFRVFRLDAKDGPFKMTIAGTVIDGEFDVEFERSDFNQAQIQALTNALTDRTEIELEVKAFRLHEKIRGGILIDIKNQHEES
jgi:hypothetical protein